MGVYLIHPALDRPVDATAPDVSVPLVESGMPRAWLALDEDEQDRRLAETWRAVVRWALDKGMDSVEVGSNDGSVHAGRWISELRAAARLGIDDRAAQLLRDAFPLNVEIDGRRDGQLLMRVHETWDGILLFASSPPTLVLDGSQAPSDLPTSRPD